MQRILALLLALCLSVAAAHATIRTESGLTESAAAKIETYRLNVPSEKNISTTQIRLMVPAGVTVTRFQVTPGFVRTVKVNEAGLVTEVTWRGRIAPMEYARFFFQAVNPAQPGPLVWKVYQTYADGSVVAWDDSDPEKTPASRTTVR
ncbi:DUF1775 domain-containing protein [Deinococcus sp. YIM 77859]|uniref:DUF1775 domain-containing protein n=1 Tax=Deinococcus sp. YIM 77859 TaxID=1540221 RepID=UPI0005559D77|nr:DUF1775 domain-containing protein [Deinococcus sp. YIM 77859]